MKTSFFKLLLIILYLISPTSAYSIDHPDIKNIIMHKEPKNIENIDFKNLKGETLNLEKFNNKLIILNFWATWCLPCREEMPSLDKLSSNKMFKNLEIIPINIGREKISKSVEFFEEINIKNLKIYNDESTYIPKKLLLRGIPTTILINKDGKEFARILGSVEFDDNKLVDWLKDYD